MGIVLCAVGEEVFFRGLFVVPHLVLLLIDLRLWPIIPVQFAAGWLLGWLRTKTGTFVPGAAVHVVANIAAGLIAA